MSGQLSISDEDICRDLNRAKGETMLEFRQANQGAGFAGSRSGIAGSVIGGHERGETADEFRLRMGCVGVLKFKC